MSLALAHSRARTGVHAPEVRVEVYLAPGLPALNVVGLPEAAVRESRDRVRAAIQSRMSSTRHAVMRGPSLCGFGNSP